MAITTQNGKTQTVLSEINMIPFIDVVLVLLIIFMITAPVIQSGLEVDVPKTELVRELAKELPVITIDAKQNLYLQNTPVKINDLAAAVKAKLAGLALQSVYFQADADVNWSTSTRVIEKLTQAGIKNIVIVTQPLPRTK
jgi:biopolymer transport protein ExbD/biopolymer transport protein TolR